MTGKAALLEVMQSVSASGGAADTNHVNANEADDFFVFMTLMLHLILCLCGT